MIMSGAKILLQMLKAYGVEYVFGLPGETTLPLYVEWNDEFEVKYILTRDERSSAYMAEAYAKISFKPGVCEGPSSGAAHLLPGILEAYAASVPLLVFTSDVPLKYATHNMLTSIDQTGLYKSATKASLLTYTASEIPHIVRRAFRDAVCPRPGPVHIRVPIDVLEETSLEPDIYADPAFAQYPAHRFLPEEREIEEALTILVQSKHPIMICGQGVLHSQAWNEVIELAEYLAIPVGTTMTGKGSISELHPLSIGVIGSRGGTRFSNSVIANADLLFYVGSNTDSAATSEWRLPSTHSTTKILQLDISPLEIGNNYRTSAGLLGDAKATLRKLIEMVEKRAPRRCFDSIARIKSIRDQALAHNNMLKDAMNSNAVPIHPLRFLNELSRTIPTEHTIIADPGVSAIYLSAFWKVKEPGRRLLFNYSLGALGYAIPAAVGAFFADQRRCVVALAGDGSFGFCVGELETIARTNANIKVIVFNNSSFGWIRGALRFQYEPKHFATTFNAINYVGVANSHGIEGYAVRNPNDLRTALEKAFSSDAPCLIDVEVLSEDALVPPVPAWVEKAQAMNIPYVY